MNCPACLQVYDRFRTPMHMPQCGHDCCVRCIRWVRTCTAYVCRECNEIGVVARDGAPIPDYELVDAVQMRAGDHPVQMEPIDVDAMETDSDDEPTPYTGSPVVMTVANALLELASSPRQSCRPQHSSRRRWTRKEEELVMNPGAYTCADIAAFLGRTAASVKNHRAELRARLHGVRR